MKAIDISSWQGNVNMKAVRDEGGVKRVILRSGFGAGNYDPKYTQNAQAMVNLGISGGIYHFSYAYTEEMARQEGMFAVQAAYKFWKKCYICFDLEYDSVNNARKHGVEITKTVATSYAIAFLNEVAQAGFIPVLYLNQDYWNRMFDVNTIKQAVPGTKIWYACWYNTNGTDIVTDLPDAKKKQVDIWQYSSKGKVPGIKGNIDMDEVYDSAESDPNVEPQPVQPDKKYSNLNIKHFQTAANADGYSVKVLGEGLVEDGIDGPKTQAVRKKILLQARYDEDFGGWLSLSKGDTVKWVQTRLTEMGIDVGAVDGFYGTKTRNGVILFQQQNSLAVDGIAGYNTLSRLFYV